MAYNRRWITDIRSISNITGIGKEGRLVTVDGRICRDSKCRFDGVLNSDDLILQCEVAADILYPPGSCDGVIIIGAGAGICLGADIGMAYNGRWIANIRSISDIPGIGKEGCLITVDRRICRNSERRFDRVLNSDDLIFQCEVAADILYPPGSCDGVIIIGAGAGVGLGADIGMAYNRSWITNIRSIGNISGIGKEGRLITVDRCICRDSERWFDRILNGNDLVLQCEVAADILYPPGSCDGVIIIGAGT